MHALIAAINHVLACFLVAAIPIDVAAGSVVGYAAGVEMDYKDINYITIKLYPII
ncbi:MAG: hypothetical protein PUD13_01305 [Lachnospira sp.]|nr:hypothetical protein [Lachnospira sp.]